MKKPITKKSIIRVAKGISSWVGCLSVTLFIILNFKVLAILICMALAVGIWVCLVQGAIFDTKVYLDQQKEAGIKHSKYFKEKQQKEDEQILKDAENYDC